MKLKDQVVSLELAKEMKDLGFKQESLWYWNAHDRIDEKTNTCYKDNFKIENHNHWGNICGGYESISAYTVAECYKKLSELNPHWDFNNSIGLIPEQVANFLGEEIVRILTTNH